MAILGQHSTSASAWLSGGGAVSQQGRHHQGSQAEPLVVRSLERMPCASNPAHVGV